MYAISILDIPESIFIDIRYIKPLAILGQITFGNTGHAIRV